ncbi:MBL fold metallo-hydrolase [Polynucleobacter sp. es-GGE-1]|uniref:MBL fold metallo-hydrolase n=1 Tax=Polynucleobacter sp. es-GGE-1 TaxID=1819724 RepID=UPI001C0C89CF|nr:MBL fold metallo-hydrolase [Polynucleobacter sp. es-GGE-1]MBU3635538.1 MBL fold metallo-hydrolase [Polynucleobacter sp. es-GGE-1]
MKITNIGGATAIIEHNGKKILFDPWMDDGIIYGSWYHYPPLKVDIKDISDIDYVYISHIHEDHCSLGTLVHINSSAEIIVMDREPHIPNFVTRFLKKNNLNFKKIHLVKPYSKYELEPGLIVDMVEANPEHEYNYVIDSGLILQWDGWLIYNANDCQPHKIGIDYILETYGQLDLALLPYSGGSAYPACYSNLKHEEKLLERGRIIGGAVASLMSVVKKLDPKKVIPFADQYVIAGNRFLMNSYAPHLSCPGAYSKYFVEHGFEEKLLLLNSGQSYDLANQTKMPSDEYQFFSESDRDIYARSLSNIQYRHQNFKFNSSVPVERLLKLARARMWSMQNREDFYPDYRFYIEVEEEFGVLHEIDFGSELIRRQSLSEGFMPKTDYLKITVPRDMLILLLINDMSWNMVDGGRLIDYYRESNKYYPKCYTFLNHLII